jgi:FtsP/CotA-like multicopper oxidase with cupredoxin domain
MSMSSAISRRLFLATSTAATTLGFPTLIGGASRGAFADESRRLTIERRSIEVLGKPASVFGIIQPDGTPGLQLDPGERFQVDLANRAGEDAIIHWHGMTPPYAQDGVADQRRPILKPGAAGRYDFVPRTGTHWMHSHHGLQEQLLMAAPLIVHSADDARADLQEVVVLLHDFTFRDPSEVLADLTGGRAMPTMDHGAGNMDMGNGGGSAATVPIDLNDIRYDAYLANDRTLEDPLVVIAEKGGRLRLRLINGATSSAFHIALGAIAGTLVAVDGNAVTPISGRHFGMAMGQRLDLIVQLPVSGGAFPILAQREGDKARTGIILATAGAAISKITAIAETTAGPIDLAVEEQLVALEPLATRPADVVHKLALTGSMMPYAWSIDGRAFGDHRPLLVSQGQRVAIEMANETMMAHPMHLHGHHFQVMRLNGREIQGAMRDTILVPVRGSVTIAFDATNPGRWPFHCHNLLHMATGMMTEVIYDGFA